MPVDFYRVPTGDPGTLVTLRHMAELAHYGSSDPFLQQTARGIVGRYPTATQRASALRSWLGHNVRFTEDPTGYELLIDPREMLAQVQETGCAEGDCDDVATLAASLGRAAGFSGRYRVLAFDSGPFQHVYTELAPRARGGPWFEMDTTRPLQALPAVPTREMFYPL